MIRSLLISMTLILMVIPWQPLLAHDHDDNDAHIDRILQERREAERRRQRDYPDPHPSCVEQDLLTCWVRGQSQNIYQRYIRCSHSDQPSIIATKMFLERHCWDLEGWCGSVRCD